jgi:prepilin-type N-terminal cleavage/methylation domain-containing protein
MQFRRTSKTGFTLVELLVVIGIIAIMISILLPTLARARQSAESVACLSNLRQIGQMAVQYANESKGYLPQPCPGTQVPKSPATTPPTYQGTSDSFYRFSQEQAAMIHRIMKGGTNVWYCPSNKFLPVAGQPNIEESDFYPPAAGNPWVSSPIQSGRTKYWWVANPNAPDWNGPLVTATSNGVTADFASLTPGAAQPAPQYAVPAYADCNKNGTIRDEYMRKLGDKRVAEIVICTDQSGQIAGAGWYFIHGRLGVIPANAPLADRKKLTRSWKNNLYGDGHAEQKRPDEVEWRWAPANPACW